MERIIVGVNEGPAAAAALRWAVEEGRATDRPVTAVLCWTYPGRHGAGGPSDDEAASPGPASPALRHIVAEALDPVQAATVGAQDVLGHPVAGLLGVVTPADLLVVGAGGTRLTRGLLSGSTSQECAHRAPCPVAIIHAPHPEGAGGRDPAGPVVVGVDGSEPSDRALRWAHHEAQRRGAPLRVLHAWSSAAPGALDLLDRSHIAAVAERVLASSLAAAQLEGAEALTVEGEPADVLEEASHHASLVVVGSRGLGNLTGLLLGSVAHRVSHLATCPVVLVPEVGPASELDEP